MSAPTTFEIGAALATCATLTSRGIPEPEANFTDYAETVVLGSGLVRGMGFPLASWHYGYLTNPQWDLLKAFVTGASTSVCIATMKNDGSFLRYNCVMEMPLTYVIRSTRVVDVTINFTNLVAAE